MKKYWIGISIGAAVLAVILLALFLLAPKSWDSGDTDSRYPYSFTERKDGLELTVSGKVPEGYAWAADLGSATAVSAEINRSSASKTVVDLRANYSGTAMLKLILQKESDLLTDRIYELDIYLLADSDGKLTVMNNNHAELPGLESGILSDKEYAIAQLGDGRLAVQLQDFSTWAVSVGQEKVGVYAKDGLYYVEGFDQGEDTVLLYHQDSAEAVQLDVAVEGTAVTLRAVSTTKAPKTLNDYTNLTLFADMYGRPADLEGAELLDADVQIRSSFVDKDLEIAVGVLTYEMDGEQFELLYTGQGRLDDLFGALAKGDPDKSGTAYGLELRAYENEQKAAAGCVLESGIALLLQSERMTSSQAYAKLSEVVTVLRNG